MKRDYASFIKFGEKTHLLNLLNEGEIYCNTIHYFSKLENEDLRKDKNDGIAELKQVYNIKFKVKGKIIATSERAQLYLRNNEDKGNIFCLYGIETEKLNLEKNTQQKLNLNTESIDFADYALIIFDPSEFVKRVKAKVEKNGYKFQFSPVTYYDDQSHNGELTPFHKSNKYKHQNEIRFWIPNKENVPLIFKIGSINDISFLIAKKDLDKIEYEPL
jgi:copper chaperone CopZ